MGSPVLPFIDQGGSRGYRWEKEENTKGIEGPSKGSGLPFPPSQPCRHGQLVSAVGTFAGYLGADDAAPLLDLQVVTFRPAPAGGVSG